MRQVDSDNPKPARNEILLFCRMRNERLRLPYFIAYHRALGVDRFYFVDNGSTDGSAEYLLDTPDCHLFYTEQRYSAANGGMDWLNDLLARYAPGHWCLILDADELLVYPGSETSGLRSLTAQLSKRRTTVMRAFLLDMYSDRPVAETYYTEGQPFTDACPFFDPDGYRFHGSPAMPTEGGPRARLFSEAGTSVSAPYLAKMPLVKWKKNYFMKTSHQVDLAPDWRHRSARRLRKKHFAEMTGALLHFKFFSDFADTAVSEARREEHFNNAAAYKVYADWVSRHPGFSLFHPLSTRYTNSQQLVELGLMNTAG